MNALLSLNFQRVGELFSAFFDSVKNSFVNFSVLDAIDIIVVATIFFVAFRFLKSRKAGALIIGIAVIVLLTFIAYVFNLSVTHFIFSKIFEIGLIVIVIIFQPEIREALEKVGIGSLKGIRTLSEQKQKNLIYAKAVDEICSAVKDLSANKTGALIVISRTTKLDEIIETGILINSNVNAFLLRNIFYDKAPLHDGAVVIDDGRLAAAGCLLPLTRRTDVDVNLGTRHRAAIGMSETSDAIVIVVSEETGVISVAYDCTLTRNYTSDTLRRFLMRKMISTSGSDGDN